MERNLLDDIMEEHSAQERESGRIEGVSALQVRLWHWRKLVRQFRLISILGASYCCISSEVTIINPTVQSSNTFTVTKLSILRINLSDAASNVRSFSAPPR